MLRLVGLATNTFNMDSSDDVSGIYTEESSIMEACPTRSETSQGAETSSDNNHLIDFSDHLMQLFLSESMMSGLSKSESNVFRNTLVM